MFGFLIFLGCLIIPVWWLWGDSSAHPIDLCIDDAIRTAPDGAQASIKFLTCKNVRAEARKRCDDAQQKYGDLTLSGGWKMQQIINYLVLHLERTDNKERVDTIEFWPCTCCAE